MKIDRSFVAELDETRGSWEFLEGLVGLSRGLRPRVVAEGVETSEQLEVLGRVGCDLAQGFLLSRPLEADALLEFLEVGLVAGGVRAGERAVGARIGRRPAGDPGTRERVPPGAGPGPAADVGAGSTLLDAGAWPRQG